MNIEYPPGFAPGEKLILTLEYRAAGVVAPPAPVPVPPGATLPPLLTFPNLTYQAPDLLPLGKPVFPSIAGAAHQSLWNQAVDGMAVHPQSATWLATIGSVAPIHPDFGAASYGAGIPYNVVPGTQPKVPVKITDFASESDIQAAGYPVPPGAAVEEPTDSHLIVVDKDNWVAYEFFYFGIVNGIYQAAQVSVWDLKVDAARPSGWTSADAGGNCILSGLVRYDEANAGKITHALRVTVKPTDHAYIPPANHYAASANPAAPPMGARLRLRAATDITMLPGTTTATTPKVRAMLQAMKTYGLIVSDNGATGYVQGTPDTRWDDSENAQLKKFNLSTFDFVNTGAVPVTS